MMRTWKPKAKNLILQFMLGGSVILAWQFFVRRGWLDPFFFSSPLDIAARVFSLFWSGVVWPHLLVTASEAVLSFCFGSIGGVVFGFLLGRKQWLSDLLFPFFRLGNAIPRVVLGPIFLLWFGLGIWSKVTLGMTVVFFVMFFNTYQGVRNVPALFMNNVRMLGASEWQLNLHVVFPSILTWIMASLQVSVGLAIIAVVIGEYMGASQGIGYMILQSEGVLDSTGVFAGISILSLIVVFVGGILGLVERRFERWKKAL
jgi:sulfonate transport system permease protein